MALFELPEPLTCWYCGSKDGPFEREHQVPVSRGGGEGPNIVWACAPCNDLKGECDREQYREGIAERLGLSPKAVTAVQSLEADRSVVSLRRPRTSSSAHVRTCAACLERA